MTTGDSCAGDEEDWPIQLPALGRRNLRPGGVTGGDKGAIMGANMGAQSATGWPATPPMKVVEKDQDQTRMRLAKAALLSEERHLRHRRCKFSPRREILAANENTDEERETSTREWPMSMSGEPSDQREHRRRRKRKRAEEANHKRVLVISSRVVNLKAGSMWPSWRQLLTLSILTVLATSLLANLPLAGRSAPNPCGSLFSHCHALAAGVNLSSAAPSNGTSPRPRLPVQVVTTPATTASLSAPATGQPSLPSAAPNAHRQSGSDIGEPEPAALTALGGGEKLAPRQASANQQRGHKSGQHKQQSTSYRQSLATATANEVQASPSSPPAVVYADRLVVPDNHNHQAGAESQPPPPPIYSQRLAQQQQQQQQQADLGEASDPPTVQVRSGSGRLEGEIVVGRPMRSQQSGGYSTAPPVAHDRGMVPMMAPTNRASGAIKVIAAPSLAVTSHHTAPTNPPAGAHYTSTRHHGHHSSAPARAQQAPPPSPSTTAPMALNNSLQSSFSTRAPASQLSTPNLYELSSNHLDQSLAQFMDGPGFGFGPPPDPTTPIRTAPAYLMQAAASARPTVGTTTASVGLNHHHHGLGPLGHYHHSYTPLPLAEHLLNEHLFPAASLARPLLLRAATHELPALLAAAAQHHAQHHMVPAGYQLVPTGQLQVKQQAAPSAPRGLIARFTSKGGHQKGGSSSGSSKQPLVQLGSQSAPSISLPPLTHFLVPRNPFRLFSSSSAHARYRPPPQTANSNTKSNGKSDQNKNKNANYWSPQLMMASSLLSPQPSKAFQGGAKLLGMDPTDFAGGPLAGSGQLTYAHSHSAEQLEKLVRAASQASGFHSPILPAIVEAPTGKTYPGLYIPAIESESESQISELRPGESAHMATLSAASNSVVSKIPGTDYILHPDEVRAMINIGETAWRQQQQQQQSSGSEAHEVTSAPFNQHRLPAQFMVPLQQPSDVSSWNPRGQQLMIEDHAQNLRDFAYVEPKSSHRDQPLAQSSNLQEHQQPYGGHNGSSLNISNYANASHQQLAQQLSNHFQAQQVRAFPAVIRVNDQDYVHLPLIRMAPRGQQQQQQQQQPQYQLAGPPVQGQRIFTLLAGQTPHQATYLAPPPQPVPYSQQRLVTPMGSQSAASQPVGSQLNLHHQQAENSPMRLATQLTPNEINQVEESILEALLIAQQLERQRKAARTMAAAASTNSQQAIYLRPINLRLTSRSKSANKAQLLGDEEEAPNEEAKNSSTRSRFRVGALFGHRRRRRRNSQQQQRHHQRPTDAIDWIPLELTQPILLDASKLHHQEAGEPLVIESKLSSQKVSSFSPLPVLLADQDTNKPFRGANNHHRSTAASELAESQTEARPTVLVAAERSNAKNCQGKRSEAFGSRVKQSVAQNCATPEESKQQQQLAASPSSQRSRHATATGRHKPRVFVDWPDEASDADYFPPTSHHHRGHHLHKPHPANSARPPSQSGAESRHRSAIGAQETVRKFVPSQLKLQFAQDYQAREGVPIYNNNVRAAGALDRHRQALVHHLGSRLKHQRQESRPNHTREQDMDENEDLDDQDEDLQGRAAGAKESRAPSSTSPKGSITSKRATDEKARVVLETQPTSAIANSNTTAPNETSTATQTTPTTTTAAPPKA